MLRLRLIELFVLFHHYLRYLRALHIDWSLVTRRVAKLCASFLNIAKTLKQVCVVAFIFSSLVQLSIPSGLSGS